MGTIPAVQVLESIDRDAIARLRAADEYFWLDLREPTSEAIAQLSEIFGLHEIVAEDLEHFEQRPKLDDYEQYVYIVFFGVEGDDLVEVHLIVHGDGLITVRRDHCQSLLALAPASSRPIPARRSTPSIACSTR